MQLRWVGRGGNGEGASEEIAEEFELYLQIALADYGARARGFAESPDAGPLREVEQSPSSESRRILGFPRSPVDFTHRPH
jgi:hypothetical protein